MDERGLPLGYPYRPEWEITPRELQALVDSGERPLLIDCRTDQERAICRLADSLHIPLHLLEVKLEELRDELAESGEDRPVVVHCHHGVRSLRATAVLRAAGVPSARSLAGGIHLWSLDRDPSVPTY